MNKEPVYNVLKNLIEDYNKMIEASSVTSSENKERIIVSYLREIERDCYTLYPDFKYEDESNNFPVSPSKCFCYIVAFTIKWLGVASEKGYTYYYDYLVETQKKIEGELFDESLLMSVIGYEITNNTLETEAENVRKYIKFLDDYSKQYFNKLENAYDLYMNGIKCILRENVNIFRTCGIDEVMNSYNPEPIINRYKRLFGNLLTLDISYFKVRLKFFLEETFPSHYKAIYEEFIEPMNGYEKFLNNYKNYLIKDLGVVLFYIKNTLLLMDNTDYKNLDSVELFKSSLSQLCNVLTGYLESKDNPDYTKFDKEFDELIKFYGLIIEPLSISNNNSKKIYTYYFPYSYQPVVKSVNADYSEFEFILFERLLIKSGAEGFGAKQ